MDNPVRKRIKEFMIWKREKGVKYSLSQFAEDLGINFQYLRAIAYGSYIVRSKSAVKNFIKGIDTIQEEIESILDEDR